MSDVKEAAAPAALLAARGLVKFYPDGHVQALRGVSLDINEAESVAITGPSGCGKSTLLHILGGLDRPTEGDVFFRGKALSRLDIDAFRSTEVGFVFQSFYLMPTLTALENIQIPMFEAPWPRAERTRRAQRLIEEVGLADRASFRPAQLSVGQRQRVAIARARQRPIPALGGRAHRQSRQQEPGRDHPAPPPLARLAQAHPRDRHPQPRSRPGRRPPDPHERRPGPGATS